MQKNKKKRRVNKMITQEARERLKEIRIEMDIWFKEMDKKVLGVQ